MSEEKESLIELRGVRLHFKEKEVLNGVNLSVRSQETQVIMGVSGCGKSTLLSIMLGLLIPDAGSVQFKNEDMTQLSRQALNQARMKIGMVYQNAALLSSLTIGENVALPLRELTHQSTREIDAIIEEKLELVGIAEAKDELPSELSGGMQKRAGMARALAMNPELILFDEPTAGLDPISSDLINELIIKLRDQQKVTSIIVTHEMESAFALATRMAFLDGGKIILEGTPDEFRNSDIPLVIKFLASQSVHKITKDPINADS
jgi:phospholipid/cholesterol/gamma-HCH transport system ATP-binding protein